MLAAKGKLTRKELKSPDEFLSVTSRWIEWMAAHLREVLFAVGAVAVIVTGLWVWQHFSARSDLRAAEAFAEALDVYRRPLKGEPRAEEGDPTRKPFENAKERAKAALEKLEAVVEKYPKSDVARLARLYIGNSQMTLEDADKAIAAYAAYLGAGPKEQHLRALALENLGYAYERKKDWAKAIEAFEQLSREKAFAERGFYHAARVYAQKGDRAKAKELYQKALEKAKEAKADWFVQEVEARLALLELEP